jgi:RNA polymerase sigma-70 factor, ECF subfamily
VPSGSSDREILLRLREREPGAFDEVYRNYHERIWRFLYRLAGSIQAAEDLFQDTWLAAARNADRLREDTELLPWLYTIARNKYRNGLRFAAFERRRLAAVEEQHAAIDSLAEDATDFRHKTEAFARALARLPDVHREVLVLHFIEGLETEQVARVLGLRPDAVRKRLSRARAELIRWVEGSGKSP